VNEWVNESVWHFNNKTSTSELHWIQHVIPSLPRLMPRAWLGGHTHSVTAWRKASQYLCLLSGGEGNKTSRDQLVLGHEQCCTCSWFSSVYGTRMSRQSTERHDETWRGTPNSTSRTDLSTSNKLPISHWDATSKGDHADLSQIVDFSQPFVFDCRMSLVRGIRWERKQQKTIVAAAAAAHGESKNIPSSFVIISSNIHLSLNFFHWQTLLDICNKVIT